jgi:crotonobetainyl-CoA:carnitine CoA-transferase CaiB-like acyl-CoA transferase
MSHFLMVELSERTFRAIDEIAALENLKPEQALLEMAEREIERRRVRRLIEVEFERKRARPEWESAWKKFEALREQLPDIPEEELIRDIDQAVQAVRAENKRNQ